MSVPINTRIEEEYRAIRTENENLRQRRISEVNSKIPQLYDIEEQLFMIRSKMISSLTDRTGIFGLEEEVRELISRKEELLEKNGYPKDYTSTVYSCKACRDTGYIAATACVCRNEKKVKYLYEYSNLSPLMKEHTFDKFDLSMYPDGEDSLFARSNAEAILENCKKFVAENEWKNGKNLYIYGETGVGKTFLCGSIASELIKTGVHVMYQTAFNVVSALEENKFKNTDNNDVVDLYYNIPVLIIDDLGTEFSTSFTSAVLFDVINSRLCNRKSTIISSNLSLAELGKQYSPRVESRITGEYELLKLYGKDIRVDKLNKR